MHNKRTVKEMHNIVHCNVCSDLYITIYKRSTLTFSVHGRRPALAVGLLTSAGRARLWGGFGGRAACRGDSHSLADNLRGQIGLRLQCANVGSRQFSSSTFTSIITNLLAVKV